MERKMVDKKIPASDILYNSLGEAIKTIEEWRDMYGEEAYFEVDHGEYGMGETLYLCYKSLETDEEFEERIEREKKYIIINEHREKEEYERLKKKYEGTK